MMFPVGKLINKRIVAKNVETIAIAVSYQGDTHDGWRDMLIIDDNTGILIDI